MFFKKKKDQQPGLLIMTAQGPAVMGDCQNGASLATSAFHEEVDRQVKKRLANQKFEDEFAKIPEYRITEHYDVKTHKDHYYLERKQRQFRSGWHATPSDKPDFDVVWERVYASETKAEVTARFARVMPQKKTARRKAA